MVGIAEQPAVIRHQKAGNGVQYLLALQIVVITHPPCGKRPVKHMGETHHALRKVGQRMLFRVGFQTGIQRVGQEGGIDTSGTFRHQAGKGDFHPVCSMDDGDAVYFGGFFHQKRFCHKICCKNKVPQGAGNPFRTLGGVKAQLLIIFPVSAGVRDFHGADGI